jgi:threonine aldolase
MVWFRLPDTLDSGQLMAALAAAGIKANGPEHGLMRLVTHWQIGRADIDRIVAVFASVLAA